MIKQWSREGPEGSGLQYSTELPVHVLSFVLARPPVSPAPKKSGRGCGYVNPGLKECDLIPKWCQDPQSGCTKDLAIPRTCLSFPVWLLYLRWVW